MKRQHLILTLALIVQAVLTAAVFWPHPVQQQSGPLFPDLEAGDVVAMTVSDQDGNSVTLRKVDGVWVLPDAANYPAREGRVDSFLESLLGLTTRRLVARSEASHQRLQVARDEYVRRIDLETTDGTVYTLYLGSSPTSSSTHFRLEGQNETYLGDVQVWNAGIVVGSWIDTAYVQVPEEELVRVTLQNANGTFRFVRDEAGEWTLEGLQADETLATTRLTATIRQASNLYMTQPLGQEELAGYGLDAPLAVVTMETADATYTLRIGAHDEESNSYVASFSESPYFVRVSALSVDRLVNNARADFLEAPPEPTP